MNKMIIVVSILLSIIFINLGISFKTQINDLKSEQIRFENNNVEIKQKIKDRESLVKESPLSSRS